MTIEGKVNSSLEFPEMPRIAESIGSVNSRSRSAESIIRPEGRR